MYATSVTSGNTSPAVTEKRSEVNNENWKHLRKQMKVRRIRQSRYFVILVVLSITTATVVKFDPC